MRGGEFGGRTAVDGEETRPDPARRVPAGNGRDQFAGIDDGAAGITILRGQSQGSAAAFGQAAGAIDGGADGAAAVHGEGRTVRQPDIVGAGNGVTATAGGVEGDAARRHIIGEGDGAVGGGVHPERGHVAVIPAEVVGAIEPGDEVRAPDPAAVLCIGRSAGIPSEGGAEHRGGGIGRCTLRRGADGIRGGHGINIRRARGEAGVGVIRARHIGHGGAAATHHVAGGIGDRRPGEADLIRGDGQRDQILRRGGQTAGDGQGAAYIIDGVVAETHTKSAARRDGIGAGHGGIGRARAGESNVCNGVAVHQTAAGEFGAGKNQRLAVKLVRAIGGDRQRGGIYGQRAVNIADGVIAQTGTLCGGDGDRITADCGGIGRTGAGQRHVRDAIAVQQAAGGKLGAGKGLTNTINLVRTIGRDREGGAVHRQNAVGKTEAVIGCRQGAEPGRDGVGADCTVGGGGGRQTGRTAQDGHGIAVRKAGVTGRERGIRRAVDAVGVIRAHGQRGRVHRQGAVDIADRIVAQAGALRGARNNRITAGAGRVCRPGADQRHVRDRVTIQETTGGKLSADKGQGLTVRFGLIIGGYGQRGAIHRKDAVGEAEAVIGCRQGAEPGRDGVGADCTVGGGGGRQTGRTAQDGHGIAVRKAGVTGRERGIRRAVDAVGVIRAHGQRGRVHRQGAVDIIDRVVAQAGALGSGGSDRINANRSGVGSPRTG